MLVSTIIPTYNRARSVGLAIDSALAQTHRDVEILVVDDGSKDDTAGALAKYGDRIRYLPKPNGGVSSARNHGLEHARGDAIAFLDSDDEWSPDKLARQVELLEARPEIDLVLTSMMVVDADRRDVEVYSRRQTIPEDGHVLRHVLRNPAMTPSTAMLRTRVARAMNGFDRALPTAEDLDLHLRIALHHQIAVIDLPLVRYMRSDAGLGNQPRTYHDYVFVMERFLRLHAHEIAAADRRDAAFAMYVRNARGLAVTGDLRGAVRLALKSVPQARPGDDLRALADLAVTMARSAASRAVRRLRP